jgi:hypothetical protein
VCAASDFVWLGIGRFFRTLQAFASPGASFPFPASRNIFKIYFVSFTSEKAKKKQQG